VTVQVSNVLVLDKIIEYFLDDIGIIFHSHRVSFPVELSVQVLPPELKALAVERLIKIQDRVKDFKLVQTRPELLAYTLGQIQDNINYINAIDESHRWPDTIEFNRRLDVTRDQSFTTVTPEFKPYV
jgi:hypothetical protein